MVISGQWKYNKYELIFFTKMLSKVGSNMKWETYHLVDLISTLPDKCLKQRE